MSRRSQLNVSDLFLAASICVVLIGAVIFIYSHYTEKYESRQVFNRLQLSAINTADILARTPGRPGNWELNWTTAGMIGLAHDDRNISEAKLNSFLNMSYNLSRELIGISEDYRFRLHYIDGSMIAEKGINATGKEAVGVERRVLYNGENAILSFVIWER